MIEIRDEISKQKVYIEDLNGERSLLSLLQEKRLVISAPCEGKGNCGRCRVRFLKGAPKPVAKELAVLTERELTAGIRLACIVRVARESVIVIENSGEEQMKVLVRETEEASGVEEQGALSDEKYGIVLDIGTTTLVAELFDMTDGARLAVTSGVNHQRAYGADVISRINAANEGKLELLRQSIVTDVVELIGRLRETKRDIAHIAIVGNTTMCHLLRGLSCKGLGQTPFEPTDNSWYETDAYTLLGVKDCKAKVTILPGISAFVGADIVAGIYAIGLHRMKGINLLLDIGTNGEMVLKKDEELLVTSTAAGPVFEGGNISCGMPSVPGAIGHVKVNTQGKEMKWSCETIDNQTPRGMCGTGIIDLVSILKESAWMDENGTLAEPWFDEGVLVTGENVFFTQKDIREVQMAKSAIRCGIEILLEEKMSSKFITAYLAGGFGQEIDVESAISIGMFPQLFLNRAIGVGNSALQGAKKYLLSEEIARKEIDEILSMATEINLARHPMFEENYLKYMSF